MKPTNTEVAEALFKHAIEHPNAEYCNLCSTDAKNSAFMVTQVTNGRIPDDLYADGAEEPDCGWRSWEIDELDRRTYLLFLGHSVLTDGYEEN